MDGRFRVGTSGYQYKHWKGILYPPQLPQRQWFARYTELFDTVEINNSFYRVPDAAVFDAWRKAAPPGFCYALKFSRYGSHRKKLLDAPDTIAYFMERAGRLKGTLGPILVQLPPRWKINLERLDLFLKAAPKRRRWAIEFRDESWLTDETYKLLRKHKAALCIHDMIPDHPWVVTTRWTYLRYHGVRYAGNYSNEFLSREAQRIRHCLSQGTDVYAYFNNDIGGHAIWNARDLGKLVKDR